MICSRNRLRYAAYRSGRRNKATKKTMNGATKRYPERDCRCAPVRSLRPEVAVRGADVATVLLLTVGPSCEVGAGAVRRAGGGGGSGKLRPGVGSRARTGPGAARSRGGDLEPLALGVVGDPALPLVE